MRQLLMKAGVPLVAGALVLTGFSGAAFANAKHQATAKPIFDLAYEGPLSGGNAQLGLNMEYAVEYAINQANSGMSQFGKLPFTLKFVPKDDQGSATLSPTDAQELVANTAVIGVVGPAFSGATKAAEPTFSAHPLATVSPSATLPALATYGWKNFFRVVADDSVQGPADANYVVKTLGLKKLYVVNDASTYGVGLADAFACSGTKDGAKVTSGSFPGTTQCSDGTASPTQYPDDAATVVSCPPAAALLRRLLLRPRPAGRRPAQGRLQGQGHERRRKRQHRPHHRHQPAQRRQRRLRQLRVRRARHHQG